MKKAYLLLRNNVQSGPYSFDELLQQNIRATDLIWVEHEGHAWCFPSEIPGLLHGTGTNLDKARKAGNDAPNADHPDALEKRAEELRQKVLSYHAAYYSNLNIIKEPVVDDALHEEEARRIEFIDHRVKEMPAFEWLSGVMVALLVIGGAYWGHVYFSHKTGFGLKLASQAVTVDSHAAKAEVKIIPQPAIVYQHEPDSNLVAQAIKETPTAIRKTIRKNKAASPAKKIEPVKLKPPAATQKDSIAPPLMVLVEDPVKKEIVAAPAVTVKENSKKKGGLFGLFKKKKKKEQPEDALTDSTSTRGE